VILDYPEFYFLDTNAASAFLRGKDKRLVMLVKRHLARLRMSSIVWSELSFGAQKNPEQRKYAENLRWLRDQIAEVVSFDEEAAVFTGNVRAYLEAKGKKIGPMDSLIAGHALSWGAGVVTHNVDEFSRVPGLAILDWQTVR